MISILLTLISMYTAFYYRSFSTKDEPAWLENSECFVYAAIPEVAFEVIIWVLYMFLKGQRNE